MGRLGVARSAPTSPEAPFSARLGDDFLLNIPTRRKILRENTRLLHLTAAKLPVFGRTLPNWIALECEEIVEFYPQLAVCIGAAAYGGAESVRLVVDDEHSKFHGDLGSSQWHTDGFRDGE